MSKDRFIRKLRRGGIWDRLEPVIIEEETADYRVEYTGKHPCVKFVCNSQTHRYFFSLTPGDSTAWKHAVAGLRRKIRQMKNAC